MISSLDRTLERFTKFYVGKPVSYKGKLGVVTGVKMMSEFMLGVQFGADLAILTLKEIELV